MSILFCLTLYKEWLRSWDALCHREKVHAQIPAACAV